MKLLFDANLSPDLVPRLAELFPGSEHVVSIGLDMPDTAIWEHAGENGFVIVSKDSDFEQRVLVYGPPPKVIWVRLGNCRTGVVESLLRQRLDQIREFAASASESLLALP